MAFAAPPEFAAWRHRDARDGFEVVFLRAGDGGYRLEGHTAWRTTARASATTTPPRAFDLRALLVYDGAGLVLDYPGIAVRAG